MSAAPNPPKPPAVGLPLNEHDALPAGTRFGEFEIIRVLGVGGFGIVYLAQDHSLERQVALKEYMPASLAARGAGPMITVRAGSFAETYAIGLRSFINEARLLARFDHPSLVKVYRFWEDNGTAYMVMPYLQGKNLRDARRAMSEAPNEAWIRSVLDPMLDALEQLHREGVFHRDIAPDNILLPPEGPPILLDFGAARRVISDRTQSLTAILKPSYAPIEQYAEMAAMRQGPWTDIYALGAVLHYLMFGVPPSPATARAVQPDLEQIEQRIVPGVSPRFMSAVAWMLGVRPLDRPQNVASLRAALNGQVPIPSSVRHDVTLSGVAASMPAATATAPAPMPFPPTELQPPFEPTLRVEGSYAAETRVDTAHQPTESMTVPLTAPAAAPPVVAKPAPPVTVKPATPQPAPEPAPMRSTPPGIVPPAYVPPARATRAAIGPTPPSASAPMPIATAKPASSRRGFMIAGLSAAAVVAAAVLWQFIGIVGGPRAAVPKLADTAASSVPGAAPVAATGGYTGPTVTQIASVPQWGNASPGTPVGEDRKLRPSAIRGENIAAGPATAREACGDRGFFALAVCLDRECERPRFRNGEECVRVLEMKQRRTERN